jgi:scyllo-inositol 2-dehydrogenase (NADP+)
MNYSGNGTNPHLLSGAIVGMGRMGFTHMAILNSHPSVKQLAVVESSACLGRAIQRNLGVKYYPTIDELFQVSIPDFLVVATPTDSHCAIAKASLEQGIHTFIEKPLSTSPADSAAIVRLAESRGVVAQVGYVNRFNEIFQAVQQLIGSGELGIPTHVDCEIRSPMAMKTSSHGWRSNRSKGGGCLSDIACHGIDLMNFFVGPPRSVIGASLQSVVSENVEDRVDALFAYEGYTGSLNVNWSDPSCRKPAYKICIETDRGRITADQHAYKVFKGPRSKGSAGAWKTVYITDIASPVRIYVRGNEYTRQLDYFIGSIVAQRKQNISGAASALEVDKVIEQVRDAGRQARVQ